MTTIRRSSLLRRSFGKNYPVAVRGEGAWIYDEAGKRYLDFSGSAAVNFIGHGDRSVADAIRDQLSRLEFVHSSQFVTPIAEEFAEQIIDFAGPAFRGGAVFFTCGGSEAVETALKISRQYQVEIGQAQRTQFLSREQAYHGATFGAMSVSGNRKRREIYLPMLPSYPKVRTPYCYRCAYACNDCGNRYAKEVSDALEQHGSETAAFIFEPISGATLGAAAPPDGYLQAVVESCRRAGVLTIADEVMTGFGRTGRKFAVDHWQVAPDMLAVGKGIASGYAPLGAVIVNHMIVDAIARGSGVLVHGFTYNTHPVSVAAGAASLSVMNRQDLVHSADSGSPGTTAHELRAGLLSLCDRDSIGDVRGRGLLWAIEFVADKSSKRPYDPKLGFAQRVTSAALERGLLLYPVQGCVDGMAGDHVLIAPPAIIKKEEISWAAQQIRESISEVENAVSK